MASFVLRISSNCGRVSSFVTALGVGLQRVVARNMCSEGSKVAVNGVELHCNQTGQGSHAVLLMPGALGSGLIDMAPQFKGLSKEKYRLVTLDPRGHGKSQPPDRDFPLDFYRRDAEDAAGLMAALGHKKFSILGWSDGANSATILAATYPDQVKKLLIWGGNAYVTEKDLGMYEATRDISKWSERMKAPMVEMYGEDFQNLWSGWIDGVATIAQENRTDLYMADCRQVRCPTLIVHGQKDAMVPLEHPHYLNQNIRGSRLVMMPEGKHNLHMRYAAEFNRHAETFLDSPSKL